MFRIKICGITNLEDALAAVDAGADAIGLNFFGKSARYIDPSAARQIVGDLDGLVQCWGIFVNSRPSDVELVFTSAQLDGAQLHGNESPAEVASIARRLQPLCKPHPLALTRARRLGERGLGDVAVDLQACRDAGAHPMAVLLDAASDGQYGGTGCTLPWASLADYERWVGDTPLVLAGGLTPENVAEAIRIVRPAAVDVASGVESAPGRKDPAKVRDFVAAASAALAALGSQS